MLDTTSHHQPPTTSRSLFTNARFHFFLLFLYFLGGLGPSRHFFLAENKMSPCARDWRIFFLALCEGQRHLTPKHHTKHSLWYFILLQRRRSSFAGVLRSLDLSWAQHPPTLILANFRSGISKYVRLRRQTRFRRFRADNRGFDHVAVAYVAPRIL